MEQGHSQPFSKEFFFQRSFEVVWAVFRVAEHSTRQSLRGALEEKAITYLLFKDSEHLADLEEVVRLSIHTNDIGSVNGSVLLREIGNLRSFLGSDAYMAGKSRSLAKTPHNAPLIEEVFAKPPMVLSSKGNMVADEVMVDDNKEKTEKDGRHEATFVLSKREKNSPNSDRAGMSNPNPNPASFSKGGTGNPNPDRIGTGKEESGKMNSKVRQSTILSFVQGRNLCHIKDLMHSLPDFSERTLRYDIQKLVNSGKLERVGSGGPNSFFRLRKNE